MGGAAIVREHQLEDGSAVHVVILPSKFWPACTGADAQELAHSINIALAAHAHPACSVIRDDLRLEITSKGKE